MKYNAIVVKGPMDISFVEKETGQPGAGEALIKVKAAGLCGTDAEVLGATLIYYTSGMAKLPITPGHEWSGEIVALGPDVTGFKVGDHVTGECTVNCGHCSQCVSGHANLCPNRTETGVMNRDGGYAEYITFPVTHLHKFSKLSFEEAAVIEPSCISVNSVIRGKVGPRDNVLVIGPGPIGLLAAQAAKNVFGAKRVILSGTRDERLVRAKNYTDGVINIRREDLKERIKELTNGEGIDVVLEAAGAPSSFDDIKGILRPAARIVLCGFFGSKQAHCDWDYISTNDIEIIGSLSSPGIWDFVIECLESGRMSADNVISHVLPMKSKDEFMTAFDIMESRKENVCKIVLLP